MKFSVLLLALCALMSGLVMSRGQVSVEVVLPSGQEQFIAGEAIPVSVRIKNRSGQTLKMGDSPGWLSFSVESRDGFIVTKLGEVPVEGAFEMQSSQVATTRPVNLAPYFSLPKQGRYSIVATVRIKEWRAEVSSQPKSFEVISGAELWSQVFGVPSSGLLTNTPPEARRFTLEQANYLRSQLRLYMRLTEESSHRVLKVVVLGPMVSFGMPDAQLDRLSNLHVVYQNGARSFSYQVFNPNGDLILRQTHEYGDSRPRLATDSKGNIGVVGGVRRPTFSDVPLASDTEGTPVPSNTSATP